MDIPTLVRHYLDALQASDYSGEIFTDTPSRLINATDNSIYQMMPQAVLTPRSGDDLSVIAKLAAKDDFRGVRFTARGGGTGTNGQSLNDCIIIDTGKHLNAIMEIDADKGLVRVQPGVVLDQLNAALQPHGLFFPPHVSPSKSATLGGMVSTDACGKGSRVYGKTSHYIADMTCVLAGGREVTTSAFSDSGLTDVIAARYDAAMRALPQMPRGISGYNLQAFDPATGQLDMARLIAGSEGSLALIKDITLRVVPKPAHRIMFCLSYDSFDTALRQVEALLAFNPCAIETIDNRILALARDDILWQSVQAILPPNIDDSAIKAIHFVEFEAQSDGDLRALSNAFAAYLATDNVPLGHVVLDDKRAIADAGALRSKCVGLLGNMEGTRRPIPFIEDTAVPPPRLADYIADLMVLLQGYGLECGAFGHVDAGCLHVRPVLDMRRPEDEALIRALSDDVCALVKRHGGVLWGEHGKGMRGEYISALLGTPYYEAMQHIKAYLDPHNQFNPGKIAALPGADLRPVDGAPLRGHYDRQIGDDALAGFEKSIQCNGNGLCFSAMPDDAMCPSYKVTRDRRHSPKGRAALLREWLRLQSTDTAQAQAFAPAVYDAVSGCLSCKACTSVCPIHVNIPDMKAAFLASYFKTRMRRVRDYLIGWGEWIAHLHSWLPLPIPALFGLVDIPRPSAPSLRRLMKRAGFAYATPRRIASADKPVLIVADAYTGTYQAPVVIAALSAVRKLGFTPLVLPFRESGKSWHVMGFLKRFDAIAARNHAYYSRLAAPLVGIDPAMSLLYRDEYKDKAVPVKLLHEWLAEVMPAAATATATDDKPAPAGAQSYDLFLHCTEATMLPGAAGAWQAIFQRVGAALTPITTGCCGMAGAYGHLAEQRTNSARLFQMSWQDKLSDKALVTGYSCRSQIGRLKAGSARHPIEALDQLL